MNSDPRGDRTDPVRCACQGFRRPNPSDFAGSVNDSPWPLRVTTPNGSRSSRSPAPFLSVPVLERVFPHGLDAHDPDQHAPA